MGAVRSLREASSPKVDLSVTHRVTPSGGMPRIELCQHLDNARGVGVLQKWRHVELSLRETVWGQQQGVIVIIVIAIDKRTLWAWRRACTRRQRLPRDAVGRRNTHAVTTRRRFNGCCHLAAVIESFAVASAKASAVASPAGQQATRNTQIARSGANRIVKQIAAGRPAFT